MRKHVDSILPLSSWKVSFLEELLLKLSRMWRASRGKKVMHIVRICLAASAREKKKEHRKDALLD